MNPKRHHLVPVLLLLTLVGAQTPAHAQSLGDRLKKKAAEAAKKKVEERTEKRAGEATDKALDTVECAASDKLCQERKEAAAKQDAAGGGVTAAGAGGGAASLKPGEGAWANYDFQPGERVIFAEDFTKDAVGDFPRRFELRRGNVEVVEWQGGRYLRHPEGSGASFYIPLPEVLPERFTVEFDYAGGSGNNTNLTFDESGGRNYIGFGGYRVGVYGGSVASGGVLPDMANKLYRARIMADGKHVKVYVNEQRVANVPNANLGRSNKILVEIPWSGTTMISNIRVAAGGRKLYDALAEKGRVATQGIYFDTGSDRIRPESTPTLKEIGQMLTEHPDLKITIEGHTDNVGSAEANQTLSEKRAEAVRQYLIKAHGVADVRLQAKGYGASKPAASNDTPEGRQQNRRVELVKL